MGTELVELALLDKSPDLELASKECSEPGYERINIDAQQLT